MIYLLLEKLYYPILAQKKKADNPIPLIKKKETPILTCPPQEKNRDFYLTYTDPFRRFRYSPLFPNQEYTPRETSQIISLCSYLPKKPEIIRKSILYVKSLPSF